MNNNLPSRENLENEYKNNVIRLGKFPLICAPLMNLDLETKKKISEKSSEIELLEVRFDYLLSRGFELEECLGYLRQQKIPFLFTMRSHLEGGQVKMSSIERLQIIRNALNWEPACIDLELSTIMDENIISRELIEEVHKRNICVITSYHDFGGTPGSNRLKEIAREEASTRADMLKIATYIRSGDDILSLLRTTLDIRKELARPMAVMGMGNLGRITRISTVALGSDLVFADLFGSSAPGQIPYSKAREIIRLLYYEDW